MQKTSLTITLLLLMTASARADIIRCTGLNDNRAVLEMVVYKTPTKSCLDRGVCPFVGAFSPNAFFSAIPFEGHTAAFYSLNDDQLLDSAIFSVSGAKLFYPQPYKIQILRNLLP